MRHFLQKLRVWLPPLFILLLFLIADALMAIPCFTLGTVTIVISVLLASVNLVMILYTVWQIRKKRMTLNPLHAEKSTIFVTGGCHVWSRNLIYLGMSGLQLASALYIGNLIGALAASLSMLAVARLYIDFEEGQLRKHFGLEWKRYEQRVRH